MARNLACPHLAVWVCEEGPRQVVPVGRLKLGLEGGGCGSVTGDGEQAVGRRVQRAGRVHEAQRHEGNTTAPAGGSAVRRTPPAHRPANPTVPHMRLPFTPGGHSSNLSSMPVHCPTFRPPALPSVGVHPLMPPAASSTPSIAAPFALSASPIRAFCYNFSTHVITCQLSLHTPTECAWYRYGHRSAHPRSLTPQRTMFLSPFHAPDAPRAVLRVTYPTPAFPSSPTKGP